MSSERDWLGQHEVVEFFRRAVGSGHLAHAYLLLGPVGVGKTAFARELTQRLFCLEPVRDPGREGGLGNCGSCRNCRRITHGNFPDLHWFERPAGKRDIPIDLVREFQHEISLKPVEGPWKVFVIREADRLNPASANCLLKVLEEPPEHSLILLLAEEADDLLPTILSRVHVIRFKGLPTVERGAGGGRGEAMGAEDAGFLARLSGGSPGLARQLHREGFYEVHRQLLGQIRGMKSGENFEVAEALRAQLSEKTSSVQEERELACLHLDGLMLALRDELQQGLGDGENGRAARLERALEALMEACETIAANGNVRLVLENLFFQVGESVQETL